MLCRRSKRRWRRLDLFVSSECFRVALPNRDRKGDPEDFACPLRCSPLDLSVQCLNSYDITYAKSPRQYPVTARTGRVFLLVLITGQSPWPGLLDLLVRVRHFDDRGALESFHKSWPARLGSHHPDCEHLFFVQGRRTARLVGNPDVHPAREFCHLDHPLHRCRKELRKRCRFWNWFAFVADYFLPDTRLRQRAVSRAFGFARSRGCSAAAACLGLETFTILRSTQQFRFVREPASRYRSGHGSDFRFPELDSSRIRPTNWTFLLKGPKIGPNSRWMNSPVLSRENCAEAYNTKK
jgi:hypothetical protein